MKGETQTVHLSEPDYKAFYKHAIDSFMYGGIDGYLKDVNPAFEKLTGHSKSELLENPFLHFVHHHDREFAISELEKLTRGFETSGGNLRIICKNGVLKWLNWRAVPTDNGGSFFAVARDVTVEMLRKENQKRIATVVDNISEIIVISSLEGHIKYINRAGTEILGIPGTEFILDKTLFDLYEKESASTLKELFFPVVFETGGVSGEFNMKSFSTAEKVLVDSSFLLIRDSLTGKPSYISVFARPLSSIRRTELERVKLAAMIESAPLLIILIDFDGNVKYTNIVSQDGTKEWRPGSNIYDFIPKNYHKVFREKMGKIINTGMQEELEIPYSDHERKMTWHDCKLSASYDLKGKIDGINMCVVDITKRKQRETEFKAREEQLQIFIKHTPASVAIFDKEMRYITCSENFLKEHQLSEDIDITGKYHYNVFPEIPDKWKAVHRRCLQGESISSELDSYVKREGNIEYIRWKVIPWFAHDEEVGGMILFTELITESILANEKLKKQTEELMQTNLDMEQFAFVTSHDLQEPLRMVGNFVGLLNRGYGDLLDENGKTYIGYIMNGVYRMEMMIKDLLDYSKLRKEDAAYTSIEIQEIIRAALSRLSLAEMPRVEITVDPTTGPLYCNPKHIQLVFENLLANSLKFNEQEKVKIQIKLHKGQDKWKVEIKDNGIGIDEQYGSKIFDIFQRLHHHSTYEGSGIGLSLCKKIIEKHKGEIWFNSTPGEGSSFFFTLPVK